MAWKRGVANNQAGTIRKGHIKEFLVPSSRSLGTSTFLTVINTEELDPILASSYSESPIALFNSTDIHLDNANMLYLHSHEHPLCVVTAVRCNNLQPGNIALNEAQRVNCKVCTGEREQWTIFEGNTYKLDNREGVVGDTSVKHAKRPLQMLSEIQFDVRLKFNDLQNQASSSTTSHSSTKFDAKIIAQHLQRVYFECIVTLEELIAITIPGSAQVQVVCRVSAMHVDEEEGKDCCVGIGEEDVYRGFVDASTKFTVVSTTDIVESGSSIVGCIDASRGKKMNIVYVTTSDDEIFPVKRKLLRPAIALTSLVQAGRGKYKSNTEDDNEADEIQIEVDACTFDRVLLYLEHVAREEEFKFDPLIAPDLLEAAEKLGINGLAELCRRYLGSFEERVRRIPIRMEEIVARNEKGALAKEQQGKRGETLLILNGMVFDITRWLSEHPGGSSIIPEEGLNGDATVFFELYHASSQSFLYLKEFYIGELDDEDLKGIKNLSPDDAKPSKPFLDRLDRVAAPWRLKKAELLTYQSFKSF